MSMRSLRALGNLPVNALWTLRGRRPLMCLEPLRKRRYLGALGGVRSLSPRGGLRALGALRCLRALS